MYVFSQGLLVRTVHCIKIILSLNKVKRNCKKRINGWKAVEIYIMKGYNCSKNCNATIFAGENSNGKYAEQLKTFLQDGITMCGYNICNGNCGVIL